MQNVINDWCQKFNTRLSPKSAFLFINADSSDNSYSLTFDGLNLNRVD